MSRTIESTARTRLRELLGPRYALLERFWRRLLGAIWPRERRHRRIRREFVSRHGLRVAAGPFAGMLYVDDAVAEVRNLVPRLLGTFELELHEAVVEAVQGSYEQIVNVGAAEGYYAVGFALRCPAATVFAFDPDPVARRLCRELARANGVEGRVVIERVCTPSWLSALPPRRTLLVVDCEGCEPALLDPDAAAPLRNASVIVELHDFIRPGSGEEILARFAATHDARIVESRGRDPGLYRQLRHLSAADAVAAVAEGRPSGMRWAVLRPRL